ncbi:MAG: M20/M25/M40 family metallo-hydrolase [Phascolarctobacterium sp.]|nr:M20/M25/M40 family metallo-hydrolase [Phascolarctobacterium sp.]
MSPNTIINLLKDLVALPSSTHTENERAAEDFIADFFRNIPYFEQHPLQTGKLAIPNDAQNRSNVFALLKGNTNKTIVFINHHDVVETSCYGEAQPGAYRMDELPKHLEKLPKTAEQEKDLHSDEWLFGRGSNDMKGGMAVQMLTLADYANDATKPEGSILFLSVADEESFSDGMRSAIPFLLDIKKQFSLDYQFLINCEPNPKENDKQIAYVGSVGKLLPVIYVQGKTAQVSNYQQGVNSISVLAKLVASTEGDSSFIEKCGSDQTTPPLWLYMRDLKDAYDFSVCQEAAGYCNILSFENGPEEVIAYFVKKAQEVAKEYKNLKVMTVEELTKLAESKEGYKNFSKALSKEHLELLYNEGKDFPSITIHTMKKLLEFAQMKEPVILIGFAPPYYPSLNSEKMDKATTKLVEKIVTETIPCEIKQYFLGVSDCSYCGYDAGAAKKNTYAKNMPLTTKAYAIDMSALAKLNIPFILLGPWGKELHCTFERVNKKSLTEELPLLLKNICEAIWSIEKK